MAFATVEDVETAQRKQLDVDDKLAVEYLLDVATEMIRGYTRQYISLVEDETVVLRSQGGLLLLPELPVVSIGDVEYDGTVLTLDTDYTVWDSGIIRHTTGVWTDPVTVTYTHGYSTIPDDIKGVCVDITKRAFENPAGLARDDLNTASQYLGLTQENMAVLSRRYRI